MTHRIPSSSSFTCPSTYTVFLNFRGIDTRYGFTNYLYKALCDKGIETFIDDEELQKGEEITLALVKAIEESRIAIVIFSENYGSSPFCLEELVKIIEMMKQRQLMVLPVFYQVEPSDVRRQKGVFGEIFRKLIEKRFKNNTEKVQKWTSSLNAAAALSGWHLEGCSIEYKFIDHIVNEVFKRTTRTPLHVTDHPVGLNSRVQKVMGLLKINSNEGVNMVGIHGIGGIGKSTIARAVYNKLILDHFDGVCFLDEISKKSKDGLTQLQVKMLGEILGKENIPLKSEDEGITIIKGRLQRKKVLLILDDVNKLEQLKKLAGGLDWFGFGSKIIITTRDKQLLDCHGVRKYEALGLNREEAHELLSWHAFKSKKADPSYTDLLGDAVSYSKGHPLALEVIGPNLCGKSRTIWESALRECRGTLNERIHKVLKQSYDGLEKNQQKIFLDLACFFRGVHLEYVTHILLHGRNHLGPEHAIDILVDKSLIKIDQENYIIMHDLIQDMGKEIVKEESPQPGKRSRIWSFEDTITIFQRNTGSENIEVMKVDLPPDQKVKWDGKAFKKMKNLEVLIIKFAYFSRGIFSYLPTSLRLLEWKGCIVAVPFNSFPKNLVTVNLSNGYVTFDRQFEEFRSLRYLNLSGNKSLTQVPDISKAPNLEKLWLDYCLNLSEVHDSVGKHSKLTGLHVAGCVKLSSFPDHIMMKSLETLDLSGCSSLKTFPEISGTMENLIVINLDNSGIESIPFSIQNLLGLQRIELEGCTRLSRLPSSILTLPKLDRLCVGNCSDFYFDCNSKEQEQEERISPLVRSYGKYVYLTNCNLRDEFLPTRLPCLSDWIELRLKSCDFKILPAGIKQFPFLERLHLIQCEMLEEIKALPPSLKKLRLSVCEQLREIGELPPNIEEIHAWNCTLLSSKSCSRLLNEKFHEVRAKFIVLPGEGIPKWFDYCYKGPSLSFWFQNKFPSVALCAVVSSAWGIETLVLIVNGFQKISRNIELYDRPSQNHILMFDLKTQIGREIDGIMIEHGWNHVEISCIEQSGRNAFLGLMGVYLYKQSTNMDDMSFTRPNWPAKRKVDDFEVQNDPYMKYHPALLDRLDNVLPTWFFNYATPIIWEAIWKMQAPPTIRILLWEICQHNLPTCQSLLRRKLIDSSLCPICKEEDETLEHVFLLCPWTRPIWFGSEFQWIIDANSLKCFEVWLCQRLKIIKRVHPNFNQVNVLLGCICWAIWNGRNDFVFEGKCINPMRALNKAETMYKEYSSCFEQQDKLPQFSVIYEECGRVKPDLAAWKIQIRKIYLEKAETMHKDHSGPSFVQQTMLPQVSQNGRLLEKAAPMSQCVREDYQSVPESPHQHTSECVELAPTPKRRRLNLKQL